VADTGSLPRTAVGASLTIAYRPLAAFSVEAAGSIWPTQTALLTSTAGGEIELLDASLRGCYEWPRRVTPGACLGLFLDRMHAEGFGTPIRLPQTAVYAGPLATASLRFGVGRALTLRFLVEGGLPVATRPFIILGYSGAVHRPAAVEGRTALALELAF
jgi:hypothetical protein